MIMATFPDIPEFEAALTNLPVSELHVTAAKLVDRLGKCEGCKHRAGLLCNCSPSAGPVNILAQLEASKCPDHRWGYANPKGSTLGRKT